MKHRAILVVGVMALTLIGCQNQQRAEVDPYDYEQIEPYEEEGSFWDALAFWNWFGDDDELPTTEELAEDIRDDMSPELDTITEQPGEVKNTVARTLDTNGREAWGDLGRLFLLDRPSRLSPHPIP